MQIRCPYQARRGQPFSGGLPTDSLTVRTRTLCEQELRNPDPELAEGEGSQRSYQFKKAQILNGRGERI